MLDHWSGGIENKMGKSSVVTLMQLVLLLLVAFFVAVSVVVCQWCFEFLGDKMLGIYNRSSHLSYLWHSSIDPVDDCRNCEELMINILYPLESDGILARGAEMKWEIRSSYLKDFSSSNKFSQLKEVVFKENNTSGLTLQPCMQISSYLDHANQFWQSNKQNIYFLLPQKDSVVCNYQLNECLLPLFVIPLAFLEFVGFYANASDGKF